MQGSMEQRACALAVYMIENRATVRATAQKFGISKSTVHMDLTLENGILGGLSQSKTQYIVVSGMEYGDDFIPCRNSLFGRQGRFFNCYMTSSMANTSPLLHMVSI